MEAVLRNPSLVQVVVEFQRGIYHDIRPVLHAIDPISVAILSHSATLRFGWSHKGVLYHGLMEYLDKFRSVFAPWYATWGHVGIQRLYKCLPRAEFIGIIHVYGALSGQLDLLPVNPLLPTLLFDIAAWHNHLHILEYLCSTCNVLKMDERAMDGAAAHGHLQIVTFLHSHGGRTRYAMNLAAGNGHLDVVRFLHFYRGANERCTKKAMDTAAGNGHLEVVQFLHTHRREGCTREALDAAAIHGHIDVVQFLLSHRREGYSPWGLSVARKEGQVETAALLEAFPHLCFVREEEGYIEYD
ncbi:hypothetical protein AC1031_012668 [Aphanomyces cochlioides]|nr:hypothetical protein AC1031_012668 [Aphanomyces cochlioides]